MAKMIIKIIQNNHQTEHLKRPDLRSGSAAWDIPRACLMRAEDLRCGRPPPHSHAGGSLCEEAPAREAVRFRLLLLLLILLLLCFSLSFSLTLFLSLSRSLSGYFMVGSTAYADDKAGYGSELSQRMRGSWGDHEPWGIMRLRAGPLEIWTSSGNQK